MCSTRRNCSSGFPPVLAKTPHWHTRRSTRFQFREATAGCATSAASVVRCLASVRSSRWGIGEQPSKHVRFRGLYQRIAYLCVLISTERFHGVVFQYCLQNFPVILTRMWSWCIPLLTKAFSSEDLKLFRLPSKRLNPFFYAGFAVFPRRTDTSIPFSMLVAKFLIPNRFTVSCFLSAPSSVTEHNGLSFLSRRSSVLQQLGGGSRSSACCDKLVCWSCNIVVDFCSKFRLFLCCSYRLYANNKC